MFRYDQYQRSEQNYIVHLSYLKSYYTFDLTFELICSTSNSAYIGKTK